MTKQSGDLVGGTPETIRRLDPTGGSGHKEVVAPMKWSDYPDFQEMTRWKRSSHQRYGVAPMPRGLRDIIDTNEPRRLGIKEKAVLAVFRKWQERKVLTRG